MELKGKKVLLMGLGILGGGVATARFLAERGAILTITDMKTEDYLKDSIDKLSDFVDIKYRLGEHKEEDFLDCDILVINPDVSPKNKFVELAQKNGRQIENELTLFYRFCPSSKIVAITGTRGKTTTANWTFEMLKKFDSNTILAGNSPENTFLGSVSKCNADSFVVLEVPSYQLEIANSPKLNSPKVAVITNLFQDHLSRHGSMEEYAKAKANIFVNQKESDFLVLMRGNPWTKFFLEQKPKSQVFFTEDNNIWERAELAEFSLFWGEHNTKNLLASSLAVSLLGVPKEIIKESAKSLHEVKWRQQKLGEVEGIAIYNDTAATSPEATVVAVERFANMGKNVVLIAGGTDKELEYSAWSQKLKNKIKETNLVLLSGSATEKMKRALGFADYNEFDTLAECFDFALDVARAIEGEAVILFSPGAKSFEKFKNEFDRGEKFNALVSKLGV